jgi:hypothetical protein
MEGDIERERRWSVFGGNGGCVFRHTILVATAAAPLSNFFASFMAVAFLTFFFSSPQYWAY